MFFVLFKFIYLFNTHKQLQKQKNATLCKQKEENLKVSFPLKQIKMKKLPFPCQNLKYLIYSFHNFFKEILEKSTLL